MTKTDDYKVLQTCHAGPGRRVMFAYEMVDGSAVGNGYSTPDDAEAAAQKRIAARVADRAASVAVAMDAAIYRNAKLVAALQALHLNICNDGYPTNFGDVGSLNCLNRILADALEGHGVKVAL